MSHGAAASSPGSVWARVKRRVYGVIMLGVLAGFVALMIALYTKAFESVVPVTLKAERAGLQMNQGASVKVRGAIVGEVAEITSEGRAAVLRLELDPAEIDAVPADVKARLLPKTLFGEKYVSLVAPGNAATEHLRAGDVIPMDRSRTAIELQQVFEDLLPVLRAVDPAKLNATLGAIATALDGRGEALGENLVRLQRYLSELNPRLPTIKEDIRLLADFAETYTRAAPDLLRVLDNLTFTANTVIEKRDTLDAFLREVTTFSLTGRRLLAANAERIIRVNRVNVPNLALLAEYAPEYPCLLAALAEQEPKLENAFGGNQPGLHITLEVINPPAPYDYPEDLPQGGSAEERVRALREVSGYPFSLGPHCYGLPNPPVPFQPEEALAGDRQRGESPSDARTFSGALSGHFSEAPTGASTHTTGATGRGLGIWAGTRAEQTVVGHMIGPVMGRPPSDVPGVATLLFGPMARGTEVSVG